MTVDDLIKSECDSGDPPSRTPIFGTPARKQCSLIQSNLCRCNVNIPTHWDCPVTSCMRMRDWRADKPGIASLITVALYFCIGEVSGTCSLELYLE